MACCAKCETPTMGAPWDFLVDGFNAVADVATSLVDKIATIPGVSFITEQLKDFAKTPWGKIVLTAMSSGLYQGFAPYLAGYPFGIQLATVTFAIPGLMRGDKFTDAWLTATSERIINTAKILCFDKGYCNKVLNDVKDFLDPSIVETMRQFEVNGIAGEIVHNHLAPALDWAIANRDKFPAILGPEQLRDAAAALGVRADMLQSAWEQVKGVTQPSYDFDPQTGNVKDAVATALGIAAALYKSVPSTLPKPVHPSDALLAPRRPSASDAHVAVLPSPPPKETVKGGAPTEPKKTSVVLPVILGSALGVGLLFGGLRLLR